MSNVARLLGLIIGTSVVSTTSFVGVYAANFIGTSGPDTIVGTDNNDNIYGLAGNNNLNGKGGNDNIYGQEGSDRINDGFGSDNIVAGSGDDTIKVQGFVTPMMSMEEVQTTTMARM